MSSHFRWYGSDSEVTVPFNARYSYPSQANKATKSVPRLPPKNGQEFGPSQEIRIELPAQGYMNAANSVLEFDVSLLYTVGSNDTSIMRFQNNIQSTFNRVRLMYGSTPLEDIPEYNTLIRGMTEWTTTTQNGGMDQFSIGEGIGKLTWGSTGDYPKDGFESAVPAAEMTPSMVNTRQALIQGLSMQRSYTILNNTAGDTDAVKSQMWVNKWSGSGWGAVPSSTTTVNGSVTSKDVFEFGDQVAITRRYCIQLNLGLFNQGKLLPLKYMASQLAIVINLATPEECIYFQPSLIQAAGPGNAKIFERNSTIGKPAYKLLNVNFIPEILEFDSSYDESFLKGLQSGGVPLKFASFNQYSASVQGGTVQTISIPERNRSIKAVFTVQVRRPVSIETDSGALFYSSSDSILGSTLQEFQYRIGGRFFPASPVQCANTVGGFKSNGAAEAYVELSKAINLIGDYRVSTSCNTQSFGALLGICPPINTTSSKAWLPEHDGKLIITGSDDTGSYRLMECESTSFIGPLSVGALPSTYVGRSIGGNFQSATFVAAIDLETSNGMEISGLNAEEQSDISLVMRYSRDQKLGFQYLTFTYFDAMIVLHENNVLELIK